MTGKQRLILDSIDRALGCLTHEQYQSPRIQRLARELRRCRDRLQKLIIQQLNDLGRFSIRPQLAALREELRIRHLLQISRHGKRLLKGMPGIDDTLRVPHKRASDEDLLEGAARIFDNVEPHAAVFRKALFPKTFLADGRRAAKALEAARKKVDAQPQLRFSPATSQIQPLLSEGREIISSIDGVILAEIRDEPQLAPWLLSRGIPKKVGRPKKKKPKDPE